MHYFRNPLKFVPKNNRSPKVVLLLNSILVDTHAVNMLQHFTSMFNVTIMG